MIQDLNAEIVAIGTEILLGEITDTNSVFIARTLRDIGINVYFMTSVGDNEKRIESAIRSGMERAKIIITCGGLGPTVDDMTRQSIAAATDRKLIFHRDLLDEIAQRFAGFRTQMTENNRRQAYLPDKAIVIKNPVGTAPSFIIEHNDRVIISLPGVPREMKYLFLERVIPYLREKYQLGGKIIKARVLKTAGIGESVLDELIGNALLEASNPTVGLAAHNGQVDVRITAKADSVEVANEMIALTEAELRSRLEQYIFAVDAGTIEEALIESLITHNTSISVSETGIDPVISSRLKSINAASGVLKTVVEYPEPKDLRAVLTVEDTLSLRQLAEMEAKRLVEMGATVGIGLVCYPNQVEDRSDNQEGCAIAVCVNQIIRSRAYGFGGGTEMAHFWTSTWGMSTAWRMLREIDE